ncbi:BamA/TamA family outer membrane protein [Flaviaesturariibacter amylovorans]|uniref:BamA/TamA family outer membrane protein n=1 Tax=Flaviaesturariibacter amylovorans TaxID=1084520 RepID=A0ABP8GYD2_9BACT
MIETAASSLYRVKISFLVAAALLFFASCTTVRDYRANTPFVYKTNIHVQGLDRDTSKELASRLAEQLHDSIAVRSVTKLFFFNIIRNPARFDTLNVARSITFMNGLMSALGYFRDTITYRTDTVQKGDQQRVLLDFFVQPNKRFLIDSITIALNDTLINNPRQAAALDTLQAITLEPANQRAALLRKGAPFAKGLLSSELDRLVNVYRNRGFLRFSREDMLIVWDTVGLALLRPTVDPLEQAQLLEALQRRRENPVADVELRLRPIADSSHLTRYYVGNVTVYPDLTVENSKLPLPPARPFRDVLLRPYDSTLFLPKVITENVYLRRGTLYDQRVQQRTANRFNSLSAWRMATVDAVPRAGTDTVDFVIRLTPARKYIYDFNIEGSQNLGGLFVGSNLVGLNFNLQNRNFARRAIQATYSLGVATELNATVTQTVQVSGAYSLLFPRLVWFDGWKAPLLLLKSPFRSTLRSSLGANARYIHRFDYLDLTAVNASWGYDGNRTSGERSTIASTRFNAEFVKVNRMRILKELIETNRSYEFIFNDGLILSTIVSNSFTRVREKSSRVLRAAIELSGLAAGAISSKFLDSTLKRFVKVDVSWAKNIATGPKSTLAFRFLGGVGISTGENKYRRHMPFYRAYFGGGANSMRAWGLRKLGPGSSVQSFARNAFPERFGDMQLESNVEYRFRLFEVGGVFINSALFVDAGNIWFLRKNDAYPGGEFRPDKLWNDLAIGVGTGLRADFSFIKFRLDYAFKAKDPSPENPAAQNKFFYGWKPLGGTLQLGVDYPF